MGLVTKYPIDPTHEPIVRGDPVAIPVTLWNDADMTDPRDLTGTFWRAHIRKTEDGTLITKFTVEIYNEFAGQLILRLTPTESRLLTTGCKWDLEQVSDDNDDEDTESMGTFWIVSSAKVLKDVSHVG